MKRFLITGAQNPGAQAPNPGVVPPSQQREPSDDSRSLTLTGCLAKGSGADQYVITDQKSDEKVTFGGPTQLDQFLNQTVQLSRVASNRTGAQGFRPESIQAASPSCDAASRK